jgi:hypothetical protein
VDIDWVIDFWKHAYQYEITEYELLSEIILSNGFILEKMLNCRTISSVYYRYSVAVIPLIPLKMIS